MTIFAVAMRGYTLTTGITTLLFATSTHAQNVTEQADSSGMTGKVHTIDEVRITSKATTRRMGGAMNGVSIGRQELFKAACCNLGESFTTNPSVDVSYSDAATGARQIRLLGLSGTYVQMLTENMPDLRGLAAPYALGYVPGPWMKNISVSKGCASVKNGYESITGQINIDYLKPQDERGIEVNLYGDTKTRVEANVTANTHLNRRLSTIVLAHYENSFDNHDGNGDGFYDRPKVRQFHASNRWQWAGDKYIFHGGIDVLTEDREGGQMEHTGHSASTSSTTLPLYNISLSTDRYGGYMKHALILDSDHGTNIALMASASRQEMTADYGTRHLDMDQNNAYASLMFETNMTEKHNLSVGASLVYDDFSGMMAEGRVKRYDYRQGQSEEDRVKRYDYRQGQSDEGRVKRYDYRQGQSDEGRVKRYDYHRYGNAASTTQNTTPEGNHTSSLSTLPSALKETVPGVYVQYTLTLGTRLTAMAGIRADHSSVYGTFVTPRLHVKYAPADIVSFRLSAGKGYRTVHALAEKNYLAAGGRTLVIDPLKQEEAWNGGVSAALNIPVGGKTLKLNAEYYYTRFVEQAVIDYDSNPHEIHIGNLDGKSYSHTVQIDVTYPVFDGLTLTAAYRLNDVKSTYGGRLMTKPLTNRYKGLLTASYKTPLGLWQIDATLQLNGGGRMPTPYTTADGTLSWDNTFPAFEQLSAQITRWFRHWSVYVGGENLTAFRQKNPIIGASDPWAKTFDPTMVWGPVHGAMVYAGVRVNIGRTGY